jgi:hypothetical protein
MFFLKLFHSLDTYRHFRLQFNGEIVGLTSVGRITALMLDLNDELRVLSRLDLIQAGLW